MTIDKDLMKRIWREWILTLGIAFAVAFFFRTTVFSPRHIPTGSMIPTIKIGEFIFVKMYAYDWHIPFTRMSASKRGDPHRGDIIVFEYPVDPSKDYIKRVIAVPGDTIEVRGKRVILNGVPVEESEASDRSVLTDLAPKYDPDHMTLKKEVTGDVTHWTAFMNEREGMELDSVVVPADSYFVMGDNRDDSQDSRYWGFVPREKVLGQAGFTWFSFDIAHAPWIRFSRLFHFLH